MAYKKVKTVKIFQKMQTKDFAILAESMAFSGIFLLF
jgi:hypothetical protein